jgi:hypothetical protein
VVLQDDGERARQALLAAIAAEHELYRAAAEARATGERWEARAALARRKEALDLAAAAHQRAAACFAHAAVYEAEYVRQQAHVAALKTVLLGEPVSPHSVVQAADGSGAAAARRAELARWQGAGTADPVDAEPANGRPDRGPA